MPSDSLAIDELLRAAMDRIRSHRSVPESTYRLQFHAGFKFRDAAAILPYLSDLGVTHLYASPYLKAKPGSMHGYDVIDHCQLNPELGTAADYEALIAELRRHDMRHIADIVPNHVGISTNENVWWNDVLENGPASIYGTYFDIDWTGSPLTNLNGRVLIPILGAMYGEELENGKLRLRFDGGGFFVSYYKREFPISPRSYSLILGNDLDALNADDSTTKEYHSIIAECDHLPDRCEGLAAAARRHQGKNEIKHRLAELARQNNAIGSFIAKNIEAFNGTSGKPGSFDRLDNLLRHQCFRLACWKTAPDEINYRRFFDVNDLAALAMERLEVFEATHGFILNLLAENKIAGLRVDHPDGLYDPEIYFRRLQTHYVLAVARQVAGQSPRYRDMDWEKLRPLLFDRLDREIPSADQGLLRWPLYVLGEKILALDESLPQNWAIDGTSGYDFLNMTNGLFVDSSGADEFNRVYHAWIDDDTPFDEIAYCKEKLILEISLASELNMLALALKRIAQGSRCGIDYSLHGLLSALKEMIACFPVYRSYISGDGASDADRQRIQQATEAAIRRNPKMQPSIFHFIRDTLLIDSRVDMSADELAAGRHFAGKFQQLTSPVTAKGIEDTAFYIYNRLLSLNEVGGDPSRFGVSPKDLHAFFQQRQRDWPCTMSTLSTHDTKRSEDVRARLNVLSEMADEWGECVRRWGAMNAPCRMLVDEIPAPDRNEEYELYQMLLGAWPMDPGEIDAFKQRVQACMLKSMRESKVHTSWTDPNSKREDAVKTFIDAILDNSRSGEFLKDFLAFQRRISHYGMLNSLSQTLIKLIAPGIPDTYQGNELWDFSLVDPDNRRPVDFSLRRRLMDQIYKRTQEKSETTIAIADLLDSPETGAIKLAVHRTALKCRKKYPGLFTTGDYLPVQTGGAMASHIFAFARSAAERIAIVAVPRLCSGLTDAPGRWPLGKNVWEDTHLILPEIAGDRSFRNLFTNVHIKDSAPLAADIFADCPVALLISE